MKRLGEDISKNVENSVVYLISFDEIEYANSIWRFYKHKADMSSI